MKKTKIPANAKVKPARPTPTPVPPKVYTTAVCPACGAQLNLSNETTAFAEIDDEKLFEAILQKVEQGEVEGDICCCGCCDCDESTAIRGIELTPTSITVITDANASIEKLAEMYNLIFALRDMVYGTCDDSLQIKIMMEP